MKIKKHTDAVRSKKPIELQWGPTRQKNLNGSYTKKGPGRKHIYGDGRRIRPSYYDEGVCGKL